MIRKFECWNCKTVFQADDQQYVECPHCHSDNVEPATFHLPHWTWKAVAGIVGVALALTLYTQVEWGSTPEQQVEPDSFDSHEEGDTTIVQYDYNELIPLSVEVSEPVFDGKTYLVEVKAKNVPSGRKFYYVRLNHFGEEKKVLQRSDDGKFSDIPFCDEDGHSYDFAIMDGKADTLLCVPIEKTGFIRQVAVKEKMTVAELQDLINKCDDSLLGAGENDALAPDCKLNFEGLPADAVNIPTILAQVMEKIENEVWAGVTVVNVDYDDMNRIKSITMKVNMAE